MVVTNDEALAALETLIKTQPKPTTPWTPVEPYDFPTRRTVEGQHPARIVQAFAPTTVLDYGCGAGYLVALLAEQGVRVKGYEPSTALAASVPPYVEHLIGRELPRPSSSAYELVICREVLEHVPFAEIGTLIARLCALSSRWVYVTTRFAKNPQHFLSVDTADDLDPTHITMINPDFLRLLFVLQGFKRRADLEAIVDWQNKGRCLVYERS